MNGISCDVIKDMLPLYVDGAASDDTGAIVSAHIAHCADCRKEYESMRTAIVLPAEKSPEPLGRLKKKLRKKRLVTISVTALATVAVVLFALVSLYAPVIFQRGDPVPYLYAAARLSDDTPFVKVDDGSDMAVYISRRGTCDALLRYIEESRQLAFQEQAGAAFLFSDGEATLVVASEIYWANYTVWEVPDQTRPG